MVGARAANRALWIAIFCVAIAACGDRARDSGASPPAPSPSPAQVPISPELMGKWSRSCALCHVDGTGGAPRLGIAEEWAPRLTQGEETLLTHTVEGFENMPPLGYCMSCTGDELRALIRFMTSGQQDETGSGST